MTKNILQAVIADDEPLLRAELRELLESHWPALRIAAEAADGQAAVEAVARHRPGMVFLDVSMPRLDGLCAARQMREQGYAGEIVFVTAYDQYAVRAFEQRAIDYLVKPLEVERLCETIARLQERLTEGTHASGANAALLDDLRDGLRDAIAKAVDQAVAKSSTDRRTPAEEALSWIRVSSGKHIQLIPVEEIACFLAVPGYTQIKTQQGEHLIAEPLKTLVDRLSPRMFAQIHRSAIVNLRYIARMRRDGMGHLVVELKHGLGEVKASRAGAELLQGL